MSFENVDLSHFDFSILLSLGLGMIPGIAVAVFMIIIRWKVFKKAGFHGWGILIPLYNTYLHYKLGGLKKMFWFGPFLLMVVGILWLFSSLGLFALGHVFADNLNPEIIESNMSNIDMPDGIESEYLEDSSSVDSQMIVVGDDGTTSAITTFSLNGLNGSQDSDTTFFSLLPSSVVGTSDITHWIFGILTLIASIITLISRLMLHFRIAKRFGHGVGFGFGLLLLNPIFLGILAFGDSQYHDPNQPQQPQQPQQPYPPQMSQDSMGMYTGISQQPYPSQIPQNPMGTQGGYELMPGTQTIPQNAPYSQNTTYNPYPNGDPNGIPDFSGIPQAE